MDPNHLTQKSAEALHDAQTKALRFGHTEVDVEHLEAAYGKGVLTLHLPKTAEATPRRVEITAS